MLSARIHRQHRGATGLNPGPQSSQARVVPPQVRSALVNGQRIDVDKSLAWSNDKEYHHFFPQAYLARQKTKDANVVGNIVLLTSKSNIGIRDAAPSEYLAQIIENSGREALEARLMTNLVPSAALDAGLADDFGEFLRLRAEHLHSHVLLLTGPVENERDAEYFEDADEDGTD